MSLPEILTTEDAASALGCELVTLQARTMSGELPGIKFGRGWIYPRDAFLKRLSELALAEAAERAAPKRAHVAVSRAPGAGRRSVRPVLPSIE